MEIISTRNLHLNTGTRWFQKNRSLTNKNMLSVITGIINTGQASVLKPLHLIFIRLMQCKTTGRHGRSASFVSLTLSAVEILSCPLAVSLHSSRLRLKTFRELSLKHCLYSESHFPPSFFLSRVGEFHPDSTHVVAGLVPNFSSLIEIVHQLPKLL